MRCNADVYAGWDCIDIVTNVRIERVLWVDPDLKVFCTADEPVRIVGGEVARTVHAAEEIVVDLPGTTFWVRLAPVMVAPLSPGRQDQQPTDKPCTDCRQPDTCRRIDYCAAHRCGFGAIAP